MLFQNNIHFLPNICVVIDISINEVPYSYNQFIFFSLISTLKKY